VIPLFLSLRRFIMRVAICGLAGALFPVAASFAAASDSFPSQPVKLVVGWAPGGSTDVFARALAVRLGERWKKEVIVDNRPGASEIIGAQLVAAAKPDGLTLLVATDQALLSNQFLFSKLPYGPTSSFVPVTRAMEAPMVLIVRATSPYQNVTQIIDAARRAPGRVSYSSNGPGSHLHQAINWLAVKAGVQLTHAAYKGGGPAVQAVLAGEVDMTVVPLSATESFLKSNMVRALAVTSAKRLPVLPSVPTLSELGYDVVVQPLTAIVAPAGTPPDIVAKIAADVRAIVADPAFAAREIDQYGYFAIGDSPREFGEYLVKAAPAYRARIQATHVKLD
jgi:tripartite-type tricarboxylate transporter receptor subunit TctC